MFKPQRGVSSEGLIPGLLLAQRQTLYGSTDKLKLESVSQKHPTSAWHGEDKVYKLWEIETTQCLSAPESEHVAPFFFAWEVQRFILQYTLFKL